MENYIPTEEQLNQLRELIQTELTKRAIHAKITLFELKEKTNSAIITMETEEFQTTPVMFKSIKVVSSGIIKFKYYEDNNTNYANVIMTINFLYRHFDGGFNKCNLMYVTAELSNRGITQFKIDL